MFSVDVTVFRWRGLSFTVTVNKHISEKTRKVKEFVGANCVLTAYWEVAKKCICIRLNFVMELTDMAFSMDPYTSLSRSLVCHVGTILCIQGYIAV